MTTPSEHGRLIVLTGPPGAGKTTVAATLAERYTPSVHLHADDFWRYVRGGAIPPYLPEAHEQNTVVMAALARAAAAYANGGYDVIVDGIIGPWFIDHFSAAADLAAGHFHYLVLRPDEATTVQRAINRGPESLTAAEPITSMYAQFADLGAYERHVIDSTALDTAATVELVERAIANRDFVVAAP
jgi:predicted kinase